MVVLAASLVSTAAANAAPTSFQWSGKGLAGSPTWSNASNWSPPTAPTSGASVGMLSFPQLPAAECEVEPQSHACYFSKNNLAGLTAEGLEVDDGDGYFITGEELTLGAKGLSASPAPGSAGLTDYLILPIHLLAEKQSWSVAGDGRILQSGVLLAGGVSGEATDLTVELANRAPLVLVSPVETRSLTIGGSEPTALNNGAVYLFGPDVNSLDHGAVNLDHVLAVGTSPLGELTTHGAELVVGSGEFPSWSIEAESAAFDSASTLGFEISGPGAVAEQDYSQLSSAGPVSLNGALTVKEVPPAEAGDCPSLTVGTTYTLVSTTGPLQGAFGNAPEGSAVPVSTNRCPHHTERQLRIAYHEGGAVHTVTGTVLENAEEAGARKQREEAIQHREAEARAAGERAVAEAYAKRHAEEEAAAKAGVQSFQTTHPVPNAELAVTKLEASPTGVLTLKLSCPAGETACTGTVALRTLNAVAARKAVLTLGSATFTVTGGKVGKVKLRLSNRARRLLARVHTLRARATISARDPLGAKHTAQTIVTLRAARHGKH